MFFCVQGLCRIVGISMGRKKSLWKWPRSGSHHMNPLSWTHMKWCISTHFSGNRKSPGCALSMTALRSLVYRPVSVYGGRWVERVGISFKGSPLISWVMQNLLSSSILTSRTLMATGYFLPAKMASGVRVWCASNAAGLSHGIMQVWSRMMELVSNNEWNGAESISHRERYAAAMSSCWVSLGSGAQASKERDWVSGLNSTLIASSPWPGAKSSRLKNPVVLGFSSAYNRRSGNYHAEW